MSTKAFIQFYSKIYNHHPIYPVNIYELCNGFSDTWDFCRNMGEMIWIEHKAQQTTMGKSKVEGFSDLPILANYIYVSAYYASHLHQVLNWALEHKNINFIVGGPISLPKMFQLKEPLPDNLIITQQSVEELFGIENFSNEWKLEIPTTGEDENFTLAYTYTIDCVCYWGKCIFCNHSGYTRKRDIINFSNLPYFSGKQRVNIYSPALTSKLLLNTLPYLPERENVRYDIYLRANKPERNAIQNVFNNVYSKEYFPSFKLIVGTEFPSKKMLEYIQKGFGVNDILEMIDIIANRDEVLVSIPFILGWNNLTSQDLTELESFMVTISKYKGIVFTINKLFAKVYTPVYDMYEVGIETNHGPFYVGFYPKLSKKQNQINDEACAIIKSLSKGTIYDYYTK